MAVTASMTGAPNHSSSNGRDMPRLSGLSMYDPLFLGIDEFGAQVTLDLVYRNILAGGEPGGGKSGLLNVVAAHAALSTDARLVLFDGKQVELGMWRHCADAFVGPDLDHAIAVLKRLQQVMDNRYTWLLANQRRKIARTDGLTVIVAIIDEIALFSATLGTKPSRTNSPHCCVTSSHEAGPAASPSWPPPSGRPTTSSPPHCGTCSATGPRSAAPPPTAPTSCWGRAGPNKATAPPTSHLRTKAPACCLPRAASRDRSRSPTCPTATSSPSPTTPTQLRGK